MKSKKMTLSGMKIKKENQEKIAVMTAYDYTSAIMVEKAKIDAILVGDSLGMTMLGYEGTVAVTMDEMLHHLKAVRRGAPDTMIIADMPFGAYNITLERSLENAFRMLKEGGADAVKMEGGQGILETVARFVQVGIPVIGHLGLTPQTVGQLGGYKIQGRNIEKAREILVDAQDLAAAGASAIVLECVPDVLAELVSERLKIPTIGIGAGKDCDGQVLVFHDMLGLYDRISPKFVKRYAEVGETIIAALKDYGEQVKQKDFPEKIHSFEIQDMSREEYRNLILEDK